MHYHSGMDGGGFLNTAATTLTEADKQQADFKLLLFLGLIVAGLKWLTLVNNHQVTLYDKLIELIFSLIVGELAGWFVIAQGWHPSLVIGVAITAGLVGRSLVEAVGRAGVARAERKVKDE